MTVPPIAAENEAEQEILNVVARHPDARQTVIFAPSLAWDDKMFQRPQQLARALARRGALVFYLQPDRSWPPVFTEIEERLVTCRTPADAFRITPDAFVYVLTWNIPLLAYFESPRVIYDYLDDLSVFQGDQQRIKRDHGDYLIKADLVLATSERLHKQAASLRSDVLLCPNGVDAPHFEDTATSVPDDLAPILAEGKPIIGYHGAMARWFDYVLLKEIAQQKPEYNFVLVGSDHDQTLQASGILDQSNIHWLNSKPYHELPRYVSRFDIGLIPFILSDITHATSPIKLFEYFAAGKPVVVSAMEESKRYPQAIVASTPGEWITCIDEALKRAKDSAFVAGLHEVGRNNSWEARAESVLERLEKVSAAPRKRAWQPSNPRLQQLLRLFGKVMKVWRMSGTGGLFKGIAYKLHERVARLKQSPLLRVPRSLADTYFPEDISQTTLYTNDEKLFPSYWPRSAMPAADVPRPKVSLIATTFNEGKQVAEWLDTVLKQTRLPDEIVIVDGGSRDNTLDILKSYAAKSSVPIRVYSEQGANISRGRNLAIEKAEHEVIAVTDCGCRLKPDWLENLITPFAVNPRTQVVSGWYNAVDSRGRELPFGMTPQLGQVEPQGFVPSSRSLALTKTAWQQSGGYPEWLTLTGEDTYFALELKRYCLHWAFVPSAVVDWVGPETWTEAWKKTYSWSTGNGEIGYNAWLYRSVGRKIISTGIGLLAGIALLTYVLWMLLAVSPLLTVVGALTLALLVYVTGVHLFPRSFIGKFVGIIGIRLMQVKGFWDGAMRKSQVDLKRLATTRGLIFIMAGVPIDDTGGGARCSQIALEFLRQNYWVVYVYRFPKWEAGPSVIQIAHPNLYDYMLSEFSWDKFKAQFGPVLHEHDAWALIDFPAPEFFPFARNLNEKGVHILYDMIDDWDSSLGNWGYSSSIEREMIRISDGLIATADTLKEKLEAIGGREAALIPNAVNSRLFEAQRSYQRPVDLPNAERIAIYIGALWGDWFDWDLLVAIANHHPKTAVVVVGDYRNQCPNPPANLYFLGLKAQTALPAYLVHSDVAIIPWKVNNITQATSPLKLYEYLAMHSPVVAPDLIPLRGIPGVFLAKDTDDFIRLVGEVRKDTLSIKEIDHFINDNDWPARIRQLLKWLDVSKKTIN